MAQLIKSVFRKIILKIVFHIYLSNSDLWDYIQGWHGSVNQKISFIGIGTAGQHGSVEGEV